MRYHVLTALAVLFATHPCAGQSDLQGHTALGKKYTFVHNLGRQDRDVWLLAGIAQVRSERRGNHDLPEFTENQDHGLLLVRGIKSQHTWITPAVNEFLRRSLCRVRFQLTLLQGKPTTFANHEVRKHPVRMRDKVEARAFAAKVTGPVRVKVQEPFAVRSFTSHTLEGDAKAGTRLVPAVTARDEVILLVYQPGTPPSVRNKHLPGVTHVLEVRPGDAWAVHLGGDRVALLKLLPFDDVVAAGAAPVAGDKETRRHTARRTTVTKSTKPAKPAK
ncbi:MAG: hypothetical protein H6836_05675 [Planctomycetes bacterium]|nr:hypothetical protein [Planctomycetota bacterium]MCB9889047.1 hypothetical protein [Planctomycetota bacterium]